MNNRFASLLLASLPVLSGCLFDVDLGNDPTSARDGGTLSDTPLGDVPGADTPQFDAPPATDGPGSDAPAPSTYCPQDVDRNTAQNPALLFPRSVLLAPPDTGATFPTSPLTVRGRWLAPRQLAQPVLVECPASQAAVSTACAVSGVLRVQPETGPVVEFVTSIGALGLPRVPEDTQVELRLAPSMGTDVPAALSPGRFALMVTQVSTGRILLVSVANDTSFPTDLGGLRLSRAGTPECISRPEPFCNRVLGAFPLRVEGVNEPVNIPVNRAFQVGTSAGMEYIVRHRVSVARIATAGMSCADAQPDQYSYEIVADLSR